MGLFNPAEFHTVLQVPAVHATLAAALAAVVAGRRTLIRIDSDATEAITPNLNLPDTELVIEAMNQRRPVLIGDWKLRGNANTRLGFSGLWIDGMLRLQGALRAVDVRHCSLTPSRGGIRHTGPGTALCPTALVGYCTKVRRSGVLRVTAIGVGPRQAR